MHVNHRYNVFCHNDPIDKSINHDFALDKVNASLRFAFSFHTIVWIFISNEYTNRSLKTNEFFVRMTIKKKTKKKCVLFFSHVVDGIFF